MGRLRQRPKLRSKTDSMARPKTQSRARPDRSPQRERRTVGGAASISTTLIQKLTEYLEPWGFPPTPLHEAMRQAAKRAGWTPPYDLEQLKVHRIKAGKRSGIIRGGRAELRRSLLLAAREGLKPKHRKNPYADESIDALQEKFRSLFYEGDHGLLVSVMLESLSPADRGVLKKTKRETLIADLKTLIRRIKTLTE
jgi:hypothetical protein